MAYSIIPDARPKLAIADRTDDRRNKTYAITVRLSGEVFLSDKPWESTETHFRPDGIFTDAVRTACADLMIPGVIQIKVQRFSHYIVNGPTRRICVSGTVRLHYSRPGLMPKPGAEEAALWDALAPLKAAFGEAAVEALRQHDAAVEAATLADEAAALLTGLAKEAREAAKIASRYEARLAGLRAEFKAECVAQAHAILRREERDGWRWEADPDAEGADAVARLIDRRVVAVVQARFADAVAFASTTSPFSAESIRVTAAEIPDATPKLSEPSEGAEGAA
jgi:hypothetical protein